MVGAVVTTTGDVSTATDLPVYVERGGEISYRHPAEADDIRMYGFVLDADRELLDRWCDLCFNGPSGVKRWGAAGSHVILNFVDVPTLRSVDRLDASLGVVREQETAIWLPVVDRDQNRMMWAIPYMFVNSDLAMVGGRETYGFPKQLGRMTIPRNQHAPAALTLKALTLRTFTPSSVAREREVVTAKRLSDRATRLDPAGWDDLGRTVRDLAWLASNPDRRHADAAARGGALTSIPTLGEVELIGRTVQSLDTDADTALLLARQLIAENVPMLLLKQFRDAVEPGAACYQAIVEVPNRITAFHGGGLLPDDYGIRFNKLAGEPVHRELGVPFELRPRIAFWLEFSFLVELGTLLWRYEPGRR
jgi:hypothetical protein